MNIEDAQRDVRTVFLGGFAGQLVSSLVWFLSAAIATWHSQRVAMWVLVLGGMIIFPATQLVLRFMGHASSLPARHPMNGLAMQIAFTLPVNLLLALGVTAYRKDWFYPAFMVALGAHYLPFMFLYGMWQFGVLAGALIASGVVIALYLPSGFSLGGWVTAAILLLFAFVGKSVAAPR